MTTMPAYGNPDVRLGDVFGRSFELLSRRYPQFLLLTVICYLPAYASGALGASAAAQRSSGLVAVSVASGILGLVCPMLASAAVTYGVVQELRGRPFAVTESLAVVAKRLLPLFGVAIVAALGAGLATLALIVPGVIVFCMWYVAATACIVERTGVFKSLSRSAFLTKGYRWRIFGVLFVLGLAFFSMSIVLAFVGGLIGPVASFLVSAFWQAIIGSFGAVIGGVLYFRLRAAKEGVDVEQIAQVFA